MFRRRKKKTTWVLVTLALAAAGGGAGAAVDMAAQTRRFKTNLNFQHRVQGRELVHQAAELLLDVTGVTGGPAPGHPKCRAGGGQQQVIFFHVPKTGGTAVTMALLDVARQAAATVCVGKNNAAALCTDSDVQLVTGHMEFGYITAQRDRAAGRRAVAPVVILRDPVERTRSLYEFIRRDKQHHLHHAVGEMAGIGEFVATEHVGNSTVELLAGPGRFVTVGGRRTRDWDHAYEAAAARLRGDFAVVGVYSHLVQSMQLLEDCIPWVPTNGLLVALRVRNADGGARLNHSAHPLPDGDLARLRDTVAADRRLYDYAAVLFADQLAAANRRPVSDAELGRSPGLELARRTNQRLTDPLSRQVG